MPKANDDPANAGEKKQVVLTCVYSGYKDDKIADPGPGDVLTLDAAEADRLVAVGGAKLVEAPAQA